MLTRLDEMSTPGNKTEAGGSARCSWLCITRSWRLGHSHLLLGPGGRAGRLPPALRNGTRREGRQAHCRSSRPSASGWFSSIPDHIHLCDMEMFLLKREREKKGIMVLGKLWETSQEQVRCKG